MGLFEPLPLHHAARVLNVMDSPYNAWGDGFHDDTGALLSALAAAKANGGGTLWLPHGTYVLGASLPIDGSVSIGLVGEQPAGYADNGAVIAYSGASWAINSTTSGPPAAANRGNFLAVQDLEVQLSGANYQGGIYGNYLNVLLRGVVTIRGDSTQSPRVGTGLYLVPSSKMVFSRIGELYLEELNWGGVLEQDELTAERIYCWNCQAQGLRLGNANFTNNNHYGLVHVVNNLGTGSPAIVMVQRVGGRIDTLHVEGAGINYAVDWLAAAQGAYPLLRIGHLEGDSLTNWAGFMTGQQCPMFEHMDYLANGAQTYGAAFGLPAVALPAGTGSGNKVTNTYGTRCRVYQSGESGTHIVDWLGNDKTLPADPPIFELEHGDSVYYATTKPGSWLWQRVN